MSSKKDKVYCTDIHSSNKSTVYQKYMLLLKKKRKKSTPHCTQQPDFNRVSMPIKYACHTSLYHQFHRSTWRQSKMLKEA